MIRKPKSTAKLEIAVSATTESVESRPNLRAYLPYDRRARRHEDGGLRFGLRFGRAPGPWRGLDLDLVVSLGGDQSKSCSPKMPPPH